MGSILNSILGSGNSGGGNYNAGFGTANVYVPQNQQSSDQNYASVIQSLMNPSTNVAAGVLPNIYGATNSIVNNPYLQSYQTQIPGIGNELSTIGATDRTQGQLLTQNADAALPYSQQILTNAFDPQNALYNRTLNQVQQQINAENAATGIGTSGAGAGIADQALSNFNIDWQNNLLNRQNTGIQGYDSLMSGIGNTLDTGANLKSAGANLQLQGAGLPYNTENTIAGNDINALTTLAGAGQNATTIPQNTINDLLNYLRLGQGASQQANNAAGNAFNNLGGLGTDALGALGSGAFSDILSGIGLL